jgi:hypothetical protein
VFRSVRLRHWLILMAAGSIIAVAGLRAAQAPEPFEAAPTRQATLRMLRLLEREEPSAASEVSRLLRDAEALTAEQSARPAWRRDETALRNAWHQVAEESMRSLHAAVASRRDLRQEWAAIEPALSPAVRQARQQAATAGLSARASSLALQAQLAAQRAVALAHDGKLREAIEAGEQALRQADEVTGAWDSLHARYQEPRSLARWTQWLQETTADSKRLGRTALVVDKLRRRLYVLDSRGVKASFPVELGAAGLRRKLHSGDRATPEGRYRVTAVKTGGATSYYKALLLDYPNAEDRRRYDEGRRGGTVPQGAGVGGLIEIHGHGGRGLDWTDGCVALTDREMDLLMRYGRLGTPVTIVGTIPPGVLDGDL